MLVKFLQDCGVALDGKGVERADFKKGAEARIQTGVAESLISSGLAVQIVDPPPEPTDPAALDPAPIDMDSLDVDEKLTPEQWKFMTLNAMGDLIEDERVTSSGMPDVRVVEEMVRERLMTKFGMEVPYELSAKQRDQLMEEHFTE